MKIALACATFLVAGLFLTSCQSPKARAPSGGSEAQLTRNNCCSLLHQLLEEQKNVSLLRFIKHEPGDVRKLVN